MVDVMTKPVITRKRQLMYLFMVIGRYLSIKYDKYVPMGKRLYLISGKYPLVSKESHDLVEFALRLSKTINEDDSVKKFMRFIYIPNYSVSLCELIVPATDVSHHISAPGTEPSGTSNMKVAMTGGIILGSKTGSNIEM